MHLIKRLALAAAILGGARPAVAQTVQPPKSPVFAIASGATATAATVTMAMPNGTQVPVGVLNATAGTYTPQGVGALQSQVSAAQAAIAGTFQLSAGLPPGYVRADQDITGVIPPWLTPDLAHKDGTDLASVDGIGTTAFTPTISFGGSSAGITYASQTGRCLRLSKLVTCQFDVRLSSKGSASGEAHIEGLPFTVTFNLNGTGTISQYFNMANLPATPSFALTADPSSTHVRLGYPNGSNTSFYTDQNFTSTTILIGSASFFIN